MKEQRNAPGEMLSAPCQQMREGSAYVAHTAGALWPGDGVRGLTMSRWMPPQLVQRMVQYSDDPPRPGMTRITARPPRHSGQSVRTLRARGENDRGSNGDI